MNERETRAVGGPARRAAMVHQREPPAGSRPGTLVVPEDAEPTRIRAALYEEDGVEELEIEHAARVRELLEDGRRLWVDVRGLRDVEVLTEIAAIFEVHPLALEDAVNVPQRPDTQAFDAHQQIVARALAATARPGRIEFQQVSLFVGKRSLLTIREHDDDTFDIVRERLRQGKGPIRRSPVGYLAYALIDTMVDGYFPMFEAFGDYLEELEGQVLREASPVVLSEVNDAKKELLLLRRALWPQLEMVSSLIRDQSPFFDKQTQVYLHDCYDHCVQLLDVVETYREMVSGLMSTYLSALGNRTNDVMKVLTMMASIFIPLSFLAGLYGMNFQHMPELSVRWAYPALLLLMAGVVGGMLLYFRRRGWLGRGEQRARRWRADLFRRLESRFGRRT